MKHGVYGNVYYYFKDEIEKFIRKFEDPCPGLQMSMAMVTECVMGIWMTLNTVSMVEIAVAKMLITSGAKQDATLIWIAFVNVELDQRQVLCTYPTLQIIWNKWL